jgi:membrane-associated protease RseP (regulator of RpoE activity)
MKHLVPLFVIAFFAFGRPGWVNAQRSEESVRKMAHQPMGGHYPELQDENPFPEVMDPSLLSGKPSDGSIPAAGMEEREAVVNRNQMDENSSTDNSQGISYPSINPVERRTAFLGVHYEMVFGTAVGSHITRVEPGTPAFRAGLKMGDIITQADGREVLKITDLSEIISRKKAGDKIKITYLRGGRSSSIWVILAERDENFFKNS